MYESKIVLCGFMGTGKTTVGRRLAKHLGGRFVDLDNVLEQRFGMPVHEVFAIHGEAAFRKAEREACASVASLGATVVAAGGGAVLNAENRAALADFGTLVCLTASLSELERRLAYKPTRPILLGDEPLSSKIRGLLEARRPAYATIGTQIDTTGRSPDRIAATIVSTLALSPKPAELTRLAVNTHAGDYDVCVGSGAFESVGALLREVSQNGRAVAVVTNPAVGPLYADRLAKSLRSCDFETVLCEVPDGEQHKTLATVAGLYEKFVAAGLDRHATVVALGGGVVGDMAGFAAATYLRGVQFVQVPTTLLAMVDASVGGKTGVDLPAGKNLVGAFKQPALVVVDPELLGSLPDVQLQCGMAEVIKHCILDAPALFDRLRRKQATLSACTLAEAIRVKVDVVNEDPLEQGKRAILNLGHTFAHGFERVSNYGIPHGIAVGVGLRAAARLGVILGICDKSVEEEVTAVLTAWELPTSLEGLSIPDVRDAMNTDKKRVGKRLRFVVPKAIGHVEIVESPAEEAVESAIAAVLAPGG